MTTFQIVFGIVTALGGFAGAATFYRALIERRKIDAQAKKIGVDADLSMSDRALDLYRTAHAEAREAKDEARDCRILVNALLDHVDDLEEIMRDAGLRPPRFVAPIPAERIRRDF